MALFKWYMKLAGRLETMGFKSTVIEKSVLVVNNSTLIIWVYVDDLIIFTKDREHGLRMLQELNLHFAMKIIGDTEYVLKISIRWDQSHRIIWIHQ